MAKNKDKKKKKAKYFIPVPTQSKVIPPTKPIHKPVNISFRDAKPGGQYCLSLCEKDEVRGFVQTLRELTTMTWLQVIQTGGKPYGGKVGLGYTKYPHLKGVFDNVSLDVDISGLRASGESRIYGYHLEGIYFVLRFDPHHETVHAS